MPQTPEEIVQASVDAYNAHDVEAYVACFAPAATFGHLGGRILLDSREAMNGFYAMQFSERPNIQCSVKQRSVMGPFVVDLQALSGEGMPAMEAMVVHEIREERIVKVWYSPISGGPPNHGSGAPHGTAAH